MTCSLHDIHNRFLVQFNERSMAKFLTSLTVGTAAHTAFMTKLLHGFIHGTLKGFDDFSQNKCEYTFKR